MDLNQRLLDITKQLIEQAGQEVPEKFDEVFNFLLDNNQIIFYIDQHDCVKGFCCYYRYGKRKCKYMKDKTLLYSYDKLLEGDYGYVPVAAARFDFAKDLKDEMFKSLKEIGLKNIAWHTDNEFNIFDLESKEG